MMKDTFILSPHLIFSSAGKEKNHIQDKVSDNIRTSQRLYKSDTPREMCFEETKQGQRKEGEYHRGMTACLPKAGGKTLTLKHFPPFNIKRQARFKEDSQAPCYI